MKKYILWICVFGASTSLLFAMIGGAGKQYSLRKKAIQQDQVGITQQRNIIGTMRTQIQGITSGMVQLKMGLQAISAQLRDPGLAQLQFAETQRSEKEAFIKSIKGRFDTLITQIRTIGLEEQLTILENDAKALKSRIDHGEVYLVPQYDLEMNTVKVARDGIGNFAASSVEFALLPLISTIDDLLTFFSRTQELLGYSSASMATIATQLDQQIPLIDSIISDLTTADSDLKKRDDELKARQTSLTSEQSSPSESPAKKY